MISSRSPDSLNAKSTTRFRSPLVLLWLAALATVVFLSLWPFDFDLALATREAWLALWASWGWETSRGDAVGNFALFVPVGIFGMLALKPLRIVRRATTVAAVSFGVAVAVQVGQVYIAERSATMVDVAWNMAGVLPGLALGLAPWETVIRGVRLDQRLRLLPWLILSAWIAYRLAPFLPSIDFQLIKDNLKPLLSTPVPDARHTIVNAAAWLAAGYLMRAGDREGRLDRLLPLLMAVVLGAEVVIAHRDGVSASNVVGALVALGLWFGLARSLSRPALLVLPTLLLAIAVEGLWPFTFEARPVKDFRWVPFAGILGGSMWLNVLALTEKAFLYSATAFAVNDLTGSWRLSAAAVGSFVLVIEILQTFQPSHVPEITDVVLVILACAMGVALSPRKAPRPVSV
jgi:VanZ family protein